MTRRKKKNNILMPTLFEKFTEADVSTSSILRASAGRQILSALIKNFPGGKEGFEELVPKKAAVTETKTKLRLSLIRIDSDIIAICERNSYTPTLRTVHRCPSCLPVLGVDTGAVHHILNGANVMMPGVTSVPPDLEEGAIVQVIPDGCEHAVAIGTLTDASNKITRDRSGVAVEVQQYLGDGLWNLRL